MARDTLDQKSKALPVNAYAGAGNRVHQTPTFATFMSWIENAPDVVCAALELEKP